MKSLVLIVLLAAIISGCADAKFTVVETADKFTPDIKTYDSTWMTIKDPELLDTVGLRMKPRLLRVNGDEILLIDVFYIGSSWMFIDRATFLVDGKPYTYKNYMNPLRHVISADTLTESVGIRVPAQFFEDLLKAKAMSVRIMGEKTYIDRDITQEHLNNLNLFYKTVSTKEYQVR